MTRRVLTGLITAIATACGGKPMEPIAPVSAERDSVPADTVIELASDTGSRGGEVFRQVAPPMDSALVAHDLMLLAQAEMEFWNPEVGGDEDLASWDIDVESFQDHARVQYYLDYFAGPARERFEIWLERLPRYESYIRSTLSSHGLPEDLVYLALIESGYSNTAVSCARAVGMWQFIEETGRRYGLVIDDWVDERRDPFAATSAAAAYLADLTGQFGAPYLAAAAYNGGENRVARGIRRLGYDPDSLTDETFFHLASSRRWLYRETRDYVPKLIAAALIAKEPARYDFAPLDGLEPWAFDEITVPEATGLDVIADLADTSVKALLELNPQFVRALTPPGQTVVVRVPVGRGQVVAERYAALPASSRVSHILHRIERGHTLGELAKQYRVSLQAILDANRGIRPERLRVGQTVVIPTTGHAVPGEYWRSVASDRSSRRSCSRTYRVRRGDTMSHIASRFGVSLNRLLRYNGMRSRDLLRVGRLVRVPAR